MHKFWTIYLVVVCGGWLVASSFIGDTFGFKGKMPWKALAIYSVVLVVGFVGYFVTK